MPHFMKLPREIRDMIYEYAVGTNHVIYPYHYEPPSNLHLQKRPFSIGLLSASKTIRAEAIPVFYGR